MNNKVIHQKTLFSLINQLTKIPDLTQTLWVIILHFTQCHSCKMTKISARFCQNLKCCSEQIVLKAPNLNVILIL